MNKIGVFQTTASICLFHPFAHQWISQGSGGVSRCSAVGGVTERRCSSYTLCSLTLNGSLFFLHDIGSSEEQGLVQCHRLEATGNYNNLQSAFCL